MTRPGRDYPPGCLISMAGMFTLVVVIVAAAEFLLGVIRHG